MGFLVPVGGALIMSPNSDVIESISKNYPGRASASPMIDLFVTLLSMGLKGYRDLLDERKRLTVLFHEKLDHIANTFGEKKLNCPRNTISFGMSLNTLAIVEEDLNGDAEITRKEQTKQVTKFGSMLFTRC